MTHKLVVAMMMHETNTFSPLPTPIESFARRGPLRGPAAIAEAEGTNTPLGGFIDIARSSGAEFTVPMAAALADGPQRDRRRARSLRLAGIQELLETRQGLGL